jgi:hypothetical protein
MAEKALMEAIQEAYIQCAAEIRAGTIERGDPRTMPAWRGSGSALHKVGCSNELTDDEL